MMGRKKNIIVNESNSSEIEQVKERNNKCVFKEQFKRHALLKMYLIRIKMK